MGTCRICGNEAGNRTYRAREMMIGLRDEFDYFQCAACDCLQLSLLTVDFTRYYPPRYFGRAASRLGQPQIPPWAFTMFDMQELRSRVMQEQEQGGAPITEKGFAHRLAQMALERYLPDLRAETEPRILDVGCGQGELIYTLAELGFAQVLGIDSFVAQSIRYANGVRVRKGALVEMVDELLAQSERPWDVVMFHHSFEHIPNPVETLQAVARILAPQGVCLVRIPVVPNYVWEAYGTDWVQLDAPRHLFLHSPASLARAAEQAGLRIERYFCDSLPFQFVGSEGYRQDIPLSQLSLKRLKGISAADVTEFAQKAQRLNQEKRGDQAAFYLRRVS